MATYEDIQREVKTASGFFPKTCWIAHSLELLEIKLRLAPSRINPKMRKHPCPSAKIAAIVEAIYKLQKAQLSQSCV